MGVQFTNDGWEYGIWLKQDGLRSPIYYPFSVYSGGRQSGTRCIGFARHPGLLVRSIVPPGAIDKIKLGPLDIAPG